MMGVYLAESHTSIGTISARKNVYFIYKGRVTSLSHFIIIYITSQKEHLHSYFKMQENGLKVLSLMTQYLVRLMMLTKRKSEWKISSSQITKGNIKGLAIDDKIV